MSDLKRNRVICDIVILFTLLIFSYNFERLWGWPTKRGFFCNDLSLNYPRRQETISQGALYVISLFLPLICMALCNIWRDLNYERFQLPIFHLKIYYCWTYYLAGFAVERLLKDLAKFSIGRLRPYFMQICQPQFKNGTNCCTPETINDFIEDYVCLNKMSPIACINLHTSFPSGHASLSAYSMIFLAIYLHLEFKSKKIGLLLPSLQLFCIGIAWFIALSRVFDHRHHWTDCFGGAILGASIAFIVLWCFYQQEYKPQLLQRLEQIQQRVLREQQQQHQQQQEFHARAMAAAIATTPATPTIVTSSIQSPTLVPAPTIPPTPGTASTPDTMATPTAVTIPTTIVTVGPTATATSA